MVVVDGAGGEGVPTSDDEDATLATPRTRQDGIAAWSKYNNLFFKCIYSKVANKAAFQTSVVKISGFLFTHLK